MLHPQPGDIADMDDGDSRLAGVMGGLEDLFKQRQSLERALSRLSDWRRKQPDSAGPDLVEALLFRTWAWAARGHGYATTVAPQQWVLFAQRLAMAQAALRDADRGSESSPEWYQSALHLGIDGSMRKDALRSIFDRGAAIYPEYYALHVAMLRALMPRWHGSYGEVDKFIEQMAQGSEDRGAELYARLYSAFAALEGDETDLFEKARARWPKMKQGYQDMLSRYPRSESVRNAYAAFACRAGDAETYRAARSAVRNILRTAWTKKYSPEVCDKRLL